MIDYECCNLCMTCTEVAPDIFYYDESIRRVLVQFDFAEDKIFEKAITEKACPRGCISIENT